MGYAIVLLDNLLPITQALDIHPHKRIQAGSCTMEGHTAALWNQGGQRCQGLKAWHPMDRCAKAMGKANSTCLSEHAKTMHQLLTYTPTGSLQETYDTQRPG